MSASSQAIRGRGKPLGQILLERGRITDIQLDEALALQQRRPDRIGRLLCELGHIDDMTLHQALAEQAGIEQVALEGRRFEADALGSISPEAAFQHKVLPLGIDNGVISLAMAEPFNRDALEAVHLLTGKRIKRYYCTQADLNEAMRRAYGSSVARMIADMAPTGSGEPRVEVDDNLDEASLTDQLQSMAREPSVVNLVNLILLEAIEGRVSDVHIEPFEKTLKVKYRIDGVLHEMSPPPKRLQHAITSRVKIMGGMNIAERFIPQDGHITMRGPRGQVDIRVSTVPTVFGESVVMRILDRSAANIDLEHLGLARRSLHHFRDLLQRPHGIVLVTGPTGSGKTTTLYAGLQHIYSPELKIITIEDPVEYQLDGINQIPVNRKRGLTFADGLRAILRQDPDVIMVGEIRDRETADIAIRSALTGHLVFSTLHTNDAAGAVTRLLDMGMEPFLLASSLRGILAQRLVRTICPHCRRPDTPDAALLARLDDHQTHNPEAKYFHGEGCTECRRTGYYGRVGIFELLRVTEPVRKTILSRAASEQIVAAAPDDHEWMMEDGMHKVAAGVTTLAEVMRVTQDTRSEGGA